MKRWSILSLCLVLLGVACDRAEEGASLAEGERAPAFSLPSASGGRVALADFAGEKPALLYFSMGPG